MNERSKQDYISYKLTKAKDALDDANILFEKSKYHAAANRLYYACFYAVTALLTQRGIQAKRHAGVKQMFSLHFIATGIIDVTQGKLYAELFNMRQVGDYDDFIYFEIDDIYPLFAPVQNFRRKRNEYSTTPTNEHIRPTR